MRLVLMQSLQLSTMGILLGLTASLLLARLLSVFLAGIPSFDVPTFALAPCVLLAVAILAASGPAVRATRLNTMDALRQE